MEPIPVCYCGNKKVFSGLLLSALSLANTTDEKRGQALCLSPFSIAKSKTQYGKNVKAARHMENHQFFFTKSSARH